MKAIKEMKVVNKKSSKGTEYSVIEVELSNGKQFNVFLDQPTKDLIDCVGTENVVLNYVQNVSKDDKQYNAIELTLKGDDSFKKLYFIDKAYELIIKKLNEIKA